MPVRRSYRGREVKHARRLVHSGKVFIRITFAGTKGSPGQQLDVSVEDYEQGLTRTFQPSSQPVKG